MKFDKTVQQYLQESEQTGPPYIHKSHGSTYYYKDPNFETLHRTEKDPNTGLTLPAVEYGTGSKLWKVNGDEHRDEKDPTTGLSLPAYESNDGIKLWYKHGKLHCEDGPAVLMPKVYDNWMVNGHTVQNGEWYLNGNQLSPKEIEEQKKKLVIKQEIKGHKNNRIDPGMLEDYL